MIWTYHRHVNITPTPNQHQKQWRFTFRSFFGKSGRMKDTYFDHHLFALLAAVDLEQRLVLGKNRWVGFLQHFGVICWDCHPPGTPFLLVKTGGFNGRFWCSLAAGSWCLKSPEKQLVVFAACTETTHSRRIMECHFKLWWPQIFQRISYHFSHESLPSTAPHRHSSDCTLVEER